ncbi:MAG TPA: MBL fold metallo-hydrolase [Longimicrobiales bacterium]
MTLDGTRTYLVGERRLAVIDPGPALAAHLDAVVAAVVGAPAGGGSADGPPPDAAPDVVLPTRPSGRRGERDDIIVEILVTHDHPDHAAGAAALAERLGAPVRAAAAGTLADGDRIATDAGELVAVATPGHTTDHIAFHWPAAAAVFCGDLLMGGQETALVAPPEGDLGAYLASLERVRALAPRVIHPAHGPSFTDPPAALDAYVRHRHERERQVLAALEAGATSVADIVAAVYGPALDPALRGAAGGAVRAYLEHLTREGRVRRVGEGWGVV